MHVSLTPEWQAFVQNELSSGIFNTADEVICAGLRRLKADQDIHLPQMPDTLEELEASLVASMESFERGEGIEGEEAFRRLRERIRMAGGDA